MTILEIEKVLLERTRKGEANWINFTVFASEGLIGFAKENGSPASFNYEDSEGNHFILSKRFTYKLFSKKPYYELSVYAKDASGFGDKVLDGEKISSAIWDTILDLRKKKSENARQAFKVE